MWELDFSLDLPVFFGHFVAVLLNWIGSKKNIVNIVDTVDIVEATWNNLGSN